MKRQIIFIAIVSILGLSYNSAGQDGPASGSNETVSGDIPGFPPLDTLIKFACQHSGTVKYYEDAVSIKEEARKITGKSWTDLISVNGTYGYGYFDQLITDQTSLDNYALNTLTSGKQARYYTGVSLRIPLSAFLMRQNVKKISNLELLQARHELEKNHQMTAQIIIEKYYEIYGLFQNLITSNDMVNTIFIQLQKAEQDFREGDISISELTNIQVNYFKALADRDNIKTLLMKSIADLEILTGMKLTLKI